MRNKLLKMTVALAAVVGLSASVQAIPISGSIGFDGHYTSNATGDDMSTATSVNITHIDSVVGTGDLSGATVANSTFLTPVGVNANQVNLPTETLWTTDSGTYWFVIGTESQSLSGVGNSVLTLFGTGTLKDGTPADDASGTWNLSFTASGASFKWSSTTSSNIPDGGATVILLGAALSAMGLLRRKLMA